MRAQILKEVRLVLIDKIVSGSQMVNNNIQPLAHEHKKSLPKHEEIEDNYENEFNDEPMKNLEDQLKEESENQKDEGKADQLGVPEEKFEIHDSDAEKDRDQIYQNKLNKLEKEDEDKYDYDIPDDFERKRKESEAKEQNSESEDNYTEPKEEIEDNYTEPKEEIEDNYTEPKEEIEDNYTEPQEKTESPQSNKEKSDEIEDNYDEEFEQNPTHEAKHSEENKTETDKINTDKSIQEEVDEKQSNNPNQEELKEVTDDVTSKDTKKKKHMRFEILEPKSLRILYDMTFYLGENQPDDLFNDKIYEQLIKTKKKENMVELISSEDFFDILIEHKIMKEYENGHPKHKIMEEMKENLMELLCLDPQYKELLMMK